MRAENRTTVSLAGSLAEPLGADHLQADSEVLQNYRARARQLFEHYGLPAEGSENWRYSSLRSLLKKNYSTAGPVTEPVNIELILAQLKLQSFDYRMVFIDGHYQADLSLAPAELTISNLANELENPVLADCLAELPQSRDAGFSWLNAANFKDGLFIDQSADLQLRQPLHLIQIATGTSLSQNRHVFRFQAGASMTLIEHSLNLGEAPAASLQNNQFNIQLGPGSSLDWLRSQQLASQAVLIDTVYCQLAANAHLNCTHVDVGGLWVRHDFDVELQGEQAKIEVNGVVLVRGRQHCDFHTRIDHQVKNGTSRENFKCIADGRGRGIYNGKILVQVGADGTDSAQKSANLLLSPHAEIDTKPDLEILADDVIASHGATVGQLDETALFYMRSRGIDEKLGRQLLMRAFCQEVIEQISVQEGKQYLSRPLDKALASMEIN